MGRLLAVVLLVVAAFLGGIAVGRQTVAAVAPPAPMPSAKPMEAPMAMPSAPAGKPAPFASLQALNGAGGPPAGHPAPSAPSGGMNVSGELLEIIQVPNFTYLRLKTAKGEEWAAVSTRTDLKNGQNVTVADAALMNNFASKTLNRTFENIWFGQLAQ
ncbi:MAG: hypothetical protein K1X89_04870 [Myxococcaceae bacterium]|nr:hypothetical protein [Myxococcaceae bacterium]